MQKKKILIFTYTDLSSDPIVVNQINWLAGIHDLYVVCDKPSNVEGVTYIKYHSAGFINRNARTLLLKLRLFSLYTWNRAHRKLVHQLSEYGFDLIIVHHLKLLPLALGIKPKAKVLLYAHEYYMNMYDHSLWWRFFIKKYFLWLADNYLHQCDYTVTVNESIKEFYERNYGIKAGYIHNTMEYQDLMPKEINPAEIKIVHHGLASTSRKLELMIEFMNYLDPRFNLTLILHTNSIVNDLYIRKIKKMASKNPRIKFRNLVPLKEVACMGNEYDIGLFFLPPTTVNIKYNLANKIFQYIQSRLMLAISPLPEMKKIVEGYNLGVVGDDYDIKKFADKLNALTVEEIMHYKNQSHKASSILTSEKNKIKFRGIIETMLENKTPLSEAYHNILNEVKYKKKVLIITNNNVNNDAIVRNQIKWLKEFYEVHVVCAKSNNQDGVEYIEVKSAPFLLRNMRTILLRLKLYKFYTWNKRNKSLVNELSYDGYDLIIVHHIKLLPLAFDIKPKAKILFYAHEYYTHMYDHSLWWKIFIRGYFKWIAEKYIAKCTSVVTVNESISKFYENDYCIKTDYIHNAVEYVSVIPSEIDADNIKILHHGLASTSRKLELMIDLMKHLDKRFSLTIVLQTISIVNDFYIRKIKKLAAGNPRIIFRGLVPYDEIVKMGNEYDIGLFFMPPTTINEEYSLGHKVFQYIQSRLMLVITPLPEMKKIVEDFDLGMISDDYDVKKLADKMNTLTCEKIMYYKRQSEKASHNLASEKNRTKLLKIVSDII